MSSSRLPGKVLKPLVGQPMLWHVINRVQKSTLLKKIIVATTSEDSDDPLEEFCHNNRIEVFRGSLPDVLDRYFQAAKKYKADVIVRITADCPLIDPVVIDRIISVFLDSEGKADYVSNTLKRTYPRGLDVEVFSFKILSEAWSLSQSLHQREHVTPFFYENPQRYNLLNVENDINLEHFRWTVDESSDFKLIQLIYENLYQKNSFFGFEEVQNFFSIHPELHDVNKHVEQKKIDSL